MRLFAAVHASYLRAIAQHATPQDLPVLLLIAWGSEQERAGA
jgi:hypothetical protein